MIQLSLVLPAYLEEENLRLLLPRMHSVLRKSGMTYEILIIDSEKPMDSTAEVCHEHQVTYVNRSGGNAFGDAVRTGIQHLQGEFALFMDSDGSHEPEFIPKLLAERHAHDVVIASRYIEGGITENSALLVLMSRALNFTYSLVLNLKCKDVSNSFKLYRAHLLKPLELHCNNFDIVEEILFKINRSQKHLRIKEVPCVFRKRMFGETKRNLFVFILTYFVTIFKLRFSFYSSKKRAKLN